MGGDQDGTPCVEGKIGQNWFLQKCSVHGYDLLSSATMDKNICINYAVSVALGYTHVSVIDKNSR